MPPPLPPLPRPVDPTAGPTAGHDDSGTGAGRPTRAGAATAFASPRWLPGGHIQTIWPAIVAPGPLPPYRRERWETPDGDFIDLDHVVPSPDDPGPAIDAPLLAVLHGLEGSSSSHYCRRLMAATAARGWRGVVVHWRGCSGEPNRLARAYHSGDSAELDWIVRRLRPTWVVGVSLGANVLVKWLGEQQGAAPISAAVALAPPQDLRASAERLAQGFSRLYCRHFLVTLRQKALGKLAREPDLCDIDRIRSARTLYDFDDAFTAPVHGFAGAHDYWQRSSCRPYLATPTVPTLVINSLNDPFIPSQSLAQPGDVAAAVTLDYPAGGGHAGFTSSRIGGGADWLIRRCLDFLDDPGRPSGATVT